MTTQLIYNEADDYYEVATDTYNKRYADWQLAVIDAGLIVHGGPDAISNIELVGMSPKMKAKLWAALETMSTNIRARAQQGIAFHRPGPRTVARRERKYAAEER